VIARVFFYAINANPSGAIERNDFHIHQEMRRKFRIEGVVALPRGLIKMVAALITAPV
jgi:hypothetical protein